MPDARDPRVRRRHHPTVERADDTIALVPIPSKPMISDPSPGPGKAEGGVCGRVTGVCANSPKPHPMLARHHSPPRLRCSVALVYLIHWRQPQSLSTLISECESVVMAMSLMHPATVVVARFIDQCDTRTGTPMWTVARCDTEICRGKRCPYERTLAVHGWARGGCLGVRGR